jgi:CO/xanthine dehydrogenase FAD-binding subunit
VDEALSLLSAYQGKGALLAGGVDLARSPRTDIEGLIDLTGLGLSYVREEEEGGLRVGATTTLAALLGRPETESYAGGVLREALQTVACPAIRHMATLGGAVVSAHPWADIPTLLVALDARGRWRGEREGKAELWDLYQKEFRRIFQAAVLLEIELPPWEGVGAFEKIGRNAGDIALLNACAGLRMSEGRIAEARVAVGARPQRGERLRWLEEALVGEKPNEKLWEKVKEEVRARIEVGEDRRASAEWRREAAGVLVARALVRAAGKAGA